jgi:GTP-binding protein EngB required for normal cell division
MSDTDSLLKVCCGRRYKPRHRLASETAAERQTMDLKTYEQIKFELAELIRSGQLIASGREQDSNKRYDAERPWRALLTRLAEDRFTVVVAGRFSRGKSSLMNAVLGMDRLPTGIVPLTSVITSVRYGTSEKVLLNYEGTRLRGEATLQELPEYVTEKGNPGNVKRIHSAEIQLPAEILRRGFFFVDTPGLGSAIFENTKTTERFIPEIDVLILVTSYESPLSEDEMRFLNYALGSVRAVFIVINKQDTVPPQLRAEIIQYVQKTAHNVLGDKTVAPFSVSARDGLAAKRAGDAEELRESGLLDFENALVEFLANNRAQMFLYSMCDRALVEMQVLLGGESDGLISKLHALQQQIDPNVSGALHETSFEFRAVPVLGLENVSSCEVCKAVVGKTMKFLARYQYDLSTQPRTQKHHAEEGGFCPLHTWHYEQVASPRGVCTAYPALLNQLAEKLRRLATNGTQETDDFAFPLLESRCPACQVRWATEDQAVASIVTRTSESPEPNRLSLSALCLPHLQLVLRRTKSESVRKLLLYREAALMERIAEDMQRYAIKHDALRRDLASSEEHNSYLQALQLLVGHRSVNAVFAVRDIL